MPPANQGVARVPGRGEEGRFDGDTTPHHHLVCLSCGSIEDFTMPGVGLSDLCPADEADRMTDLLDPGAAKRRKAEAATDAIRARFGRDAIIKGRALR